MTALIFATMIVLMIYAAGTFNGWLFILAWFGGSWLIALIAIEKDVRAGGGPRAHRAF